MKRYISVILALDVWDDGDYILQLSGDLSKNEMMDLAISAKVYEN